MNFSSPIILYAFFTEPQSCQVYSPTDSKNYPFSTLCYQSSKVFLSFMYFRVYFSCIFHRFFAFLLCPFLFVLFKLPAHFPVYFTCGQRFPREIHLSRHLYALVDGMRNIQFKHFWLKCFGNVWIPITFVILIQTVKKL